MDIDVREKPLQLSLDPCEGKWLIKALSVTPFRRLLPKNVANQGTHRITGKGTQNKAYNFTFIQSVLIFVNVNHLPSIMVTFNVTGDLSSNT